MSFSDIENVYLSMLKRIGAIVTDGHFVFNSGRHGSVYVNKDAVSAHTKMTFKFCIEIASEFIRDSVEVVIAPATGGIALEQWVAYHLSGAMRYEVPGVYADKEKVSLVTHEEVGTVLVPVGERFSIKRHYDKFIKGKRVLVVDDVLTTGKTARMVVEAVRELGGKVVGLGVLCNRGGVTTKDVGGIPRIRSLVELKLDTWEEIDCALCARGVPINTELGKGAEFLARRKG